MFTAGDEGLSSECHGGFSSPIRRFSASAKVGKGVLEHAGEPILLVVRGHDYAERLARGVPGDRKLLLPRWLPFEGTARETKAGHTTRRHFA